VGSCEDRKLGRWEDRKLGKCETGKTKIELKKTGKTIIIEMR
jgi:hypothetical protein